MEGKKRDNHMLKTYLNTDGKKRFVEKENWKKIRQKYKEVVQQIQGKL